MSVRATANWLKQSRNKGNPRMHESAELVFFRNFTKHRILINSIGTIRIVGITIIQVNKFIGNTVSILVQLANNLQFSGAHPFTNELLLSDYADDTTEFMYFLEGSANSRSSNTKHVLCNSKDW
jgi:hypothetical protein